jgi:hypothetical protein
MFKRELLKNLKDLKNLQKIKENVVSLASVVPA